MLPLVHLASVPLLLASVLLLSACGDSAPATAHQRSTPKNMVLLIGDGMGVAQVNGRNALSWEEKFRLDVWYVDNQSSWLDLKILALTVKKVFVREGISAAGEVTAAKFTGSREDKA